MTTKLPKHDYPGMGMPLRYEPRYGAFSHYQRICSPIFVRELAMMDVMEKLTDKPDWHKKVFDEDIVAKWREEALAIPDDDLWKLAASDKAMKWAGPGVLELGDSGDITQRPDNILSTNAFDCCIKELRGKAKYFEQTGIIPTLDLKNSVAKSDTLVTSELRSALRDAFDRLKADHAASPDWHPSTNEMVQDLVHPSMYPLVYGRTRIFEDECVGLDDAVRKWAGKGEMILREDWKYVVGRDRYKPAMGGGLIPNEFWSDNYQWLPANVAFTENGGVKFTSYINNLHPNKYPEIYRTIEKLVETSLPMWDQCLGIREEINAGRKDPRIANPNSCDDDEESLWTPPKAECADLDVSESDLDEQGWEPDYCDAEDLTEYKWKVVRKPVLPEPSFTDVNYTPATANRLFTNFRERGLQIIVKIASIELTPEKPTFPAGGWHVEGQMNEHICATALYYLDSENITSSNLSFRMQTDEELDTEGPYRVQQDSYHWLESALGTYLGQGNDPCLQNFGTVDTREGRLLAFPNVFQHRVSPFELVDKTKSGHRRFIALWLVDPNLRIINTANVPPQQMSWYAESVFGSTKESREDGLKKLPVELINLLQDKGILSSEEGTIKLKENARLPEELMDMVRAHFKADEQQMPMSVEEAHEHRRNLMAERTAFVDSADKEWSGHTYNFCEH